MKIHDIFLKKKTYHFTEAISCSVVTTTFSLIRDEVDVLDGENLYPYMDVPE